MPPSIMAEGSVGDLTAGEKIDYLITTLGQMALKTSPQAQISNCAVQSSFRLMGPLFSGYGHDPGPINPKPTNRKYFRWK